MEVIDCVVSPNRVRMQMYNCVKRLPVGIYTSVGTNVHYLLELLHVNLQLCTMASVESKSVLMSSYKSFTEVNQRNLRSCV